MKHYFMIHTIDGEHHSGYKKICETLEKAKKEVPNFADWCCQDGTCSIYEVDENFTIYKIYYYMSGKLWKEEKFR